VLASEDIVEILKQRKLQQNMHKTWDTINDLTENSWVYKKEKRYHLKAGIIYSIK
jgi:hypothetical protein